MHLSSAAATKPTCSFPQSVPPFSDSAGRDLPESLAARTPYFTPFPEAGRPSSPSETSKGPRGRVLVLDRDPRDRTVFQDLSQALPVDLVITDSHEEALSRLGSQKTDLVFLDAHPRESHWPDILRTIKAQDPSKGLPVLLFVPAQDPEVKKKGLEAGADDLIVKPLLAEELTAKIKRYLAWEGMRKGGFEKSTGGSAFRTQEAEEAEKRAESLQRSLKRILHQMALSVEMREPYTLGHQQRVADLALAVGRELDLPQASLAALFSAAKIHDLGKMVVPVEILTKPTRLSTGEFDLIRLHPEAGAALVEDLENGRSVARIILEHHERINGSGYPKGLRGDQMLPESRILAVADVVEAICNQRPYRHPFGLELALDEIEKNQGLLYDASAAEACLGLFRKKGFRWK